MSYYFSIQLMLVVSLSCLQQTAFCADVDLTLGRRFEEKKPVATMPLKIMSDKVAKKFDDLAKILMQPEPTLPKNIAHRNKQIGDLSFSLGKSIKQFNSLLPGASKNRKNALEAIDKLKNPKLYTFFLTQNNKSLFLTQNNKSLLDQAIKDIGEFKDEEDYTKEFIWVSEDDKEAQPESMSSSSVNPSLMSSLERVEKAIQEAETQLSKLAPEKNPEETKKIKKKKEITVSMPTRREFRSIAWNNTSREMYLGLVWIYNNSNAVLGTKGKILATIKIELQKIELQKLDPSKKRSRATILPQVTEINGKEYYQLPDLLGGGMISDDMVRKYNKLEDFLQAFCEYNKKKQSDLLRQEGAVNKSRSEKRHLLRQYARTLNLCARLDPRKKEDTQKRLGTIKKTIKQLNLQIKAEEKRPSASPTPSSTSALPVVVSPAIPSTSIPEIIPVTTRTGMPTPMVSTTTTTSMSLSEKIAKLVGSNPLEKSDLTQIRDILLYQGSELNEDDRKKLLDNYKKDAGDEAYAKILVAMATKPTEQADEDAEARNKARGVFTPPDSPSSSIIDEGPPKSIPAPIPASIPTLAPTPMTPQPSAASTLTISSAPLSSTSSQSSILTAPQPPTPTLPSTTPAPTPSPTAAPTATPPNQQETDNEKIIEAGIDRKRRIIKRLEDFTRNPSITADARKTIEQLRDEEKIESDSDIQSLTKNITYDERVRLKDYHRHSDRIDDLIKSILTEPKVAFSASTPAPTPTPTPQGFFGGFGGFGAIFNTIVIKPITSLLSGIGNLFNTIVSFFAPRR